MDDLLYQIYLFKLKFQSDDSTKERPILTIIYDNELLSFELLGLYSDKPKFSENSYYQDFMYPIRDWAKAGLTRKTWVNVSRPITLPFTALVGKPYFGKLTRYDATKLMDFYDHYWLARED